MTYFSLRRVTIVMTGGVMTTAVKTATSMITVTGMGTGTTGTTGGTGTTGTGAAETGNLVTTQRWSQCTVKPL